MYSGLFYCIVGSGFSGSVLAERIASVLDKKVLVVEKRSHIGGNSFSDIDSATGIEVHKYGSHIFHTSKKNVWDYIRRFGEFSNYQHKVMALFKHRIYQMPINLKTINDFFNKNFSPYEAIEFLNKEITACGIIVPKNLEEKAISSIGLKLYDAFIKGYTRKQWGKDPVLLPADIISRLPVRYNYNTNYFNDFYQGIPLGGYGQLFDKLLAHRNIELKLNTPYEEIAHYIPPTCTIIYTGMIDRLFDYQFGALEWRSLNFEWETPKISDFQGTSVVNYLDESVPFTRIHEFKHYHPEKTEIFNAAQTVICREYPKAWQQGVEAFYPVNDTYNNERLKKYLHVAKQRPNLIVTGRLGLYKYWDMDTAIGKALNLFERIKKEDNIAHQHTDI
jgi:UDP-galactopyranose mutase